MYVSIIVFCVRRCWGSRNARCHPYMVLTFTLSYHLFHTDSLLVLFSNKKKGNGRVCSERVGDCNWAYLCPFSLQVKEVTPCFSLIYCTWWCFRLPEPDINDAECINTVQSSSHWAIHDSPSLASLSYSCFGGHGPSPAGCPWSCTAASSASVRTAVWACAGAAGCSPARRSASAWWRSRRWCWPGRPGRFLRDKHYQIPMPIPFYYRLWLQERSFSFTFLFQFLGVRLIGCLISRHVKVLLLSIRILAFFVVAALLATYKARTWRRQ